MAFLGLCSVASLLAWVFGVGPFATWFWAFSAPALALLVAVVTLATRNGRRPELRTAVVAGTIGGLLGTLGYDVFRLPFHLAGLRLLTPIDSYGVLLLGADHSDDLTGLVGWMYHVTNGVGFGIAYAVVALHRRWWWGVLWAMVLETATILTPFVGTYGIEGKWAIIAIAYAAHVAYGVPLGRWVERAGTRVPQLHEMTKRPIAVALLVTAAGLVLWHHPWTVLGDRDDGGGGALSVAVRDGRFVPRWLRVAPGDCVLVHNRDAAGYTVTGAGHDVALAARGTASVCFDDDGVHRVRTSSRPDAGGYVIVDAEKPRSRPSQARPSTSSPSTAAPPPVVAATQPCAQPESGQQIAGMNDAFVRTSGVWAVLPANHAGRTPVLLGTDDNGQSWIYHCVPHAASGESVFFLDHTRGWAIVVDVEDSISLVLRTVDGGRTWGAGVLPAGTYLLRDAFFIDEQHGWATGERAGSAVVLRSDDGGASWSEVHAPAGTPSPRKVRFVSRSRGWVLDGGGKVASTSDGGTTWTVQTLEQATYTDIAFADEHTGWVAGNDDERARGYVWATRDGGTTWTKAGDFPHALNDVAAEDATTVRAGGGPAGTVEVSRDGGRTWQAQPALPSLAKVWALDDATVWGYSHDADRAGCLYSSVSAQGEPGIWTAHVLFNTPGCRATHA